MKLATIYYKCTVREQKWGKKNERRWEERKPKKKVKTAVSLLNPKTIPKFCFLYMPELCKLINILYLDIPGEGREVYDL